jgi:periplasmic protein TonB
LKRNDPKTTLDDIAFDGRNKDYGAYLIRKTHDARLFRSFLYSLGVVVLFLFVYQRIIQNRSKDYYYNPFLNATVVGVNIIQNPYTPDVGQQSGKSFSQTIDVPQEIVEDETLTADEEKPESPSAGKGDSTSLTQNESGLNGQDNSNGSEGGIEGEIYGSADLNPQFPGGVKAMQDFINENLKYPETARQFNIKGTILIYVVITSDGALMDVKVVKGLQDDLDAEAVRVVKSMPLWKPAMRGGVPVNVRCTLPIAVSPLNSRR